MSDLAVAKVKDYDNSAITTRTVTRSDDPESIFSGVGIREKTF